jgi:hypothetical protein
VIPIDDEELSGAALTGSGLPDNGGSDGTSIDLSDDDCLVMAIGTLVYACHEGNYSLPTILAGSRRRESSR